MDLKDSVDFVNGKNILIHCKVICIASTGQIIPHNKTIGKNDPRARYVAVRSVSHIQETTKPEKEKGK